MPHETDTPLEVKLISQAAPVAVQDGWRPVPVRPSIEMVEAGYEASLGEPCRSGHSRVIDQYEAMLSAAPTPPAKETADYLDGLIDRLNEAQQDINLVANETMSQPLCSASALLDEVEAALRRYAAPPAQQSQWVPELFGIDRVPDDFRNQASGYRAGWNDCRAAMQAAPGGSAAPEQAGPRLAISSQEQLAALLNGVQALHEISAELIAECVFEQIRDATGETAAPGQAEPIPVAPERAEQPVKWGSAGTVGNLIAQLRTIDPSMPVYASLRVKNGVRDGVMLKGLIISYEHGDGRFIVRDGTERCVVIWTQPDDRHAEQDAEWVEKAMEQAQVFASAWSLVGGPFDTGDGLNQAKEEKELLRKLLEGGR